MENRIRNRAITLVILLFGCWLLYSASLNAISEEPLFSQTEGISGVSTNGVLSRRNTENTQSAMAARADVQTFIAAMAKKHHFSETALNFLFSNIRFRDDIIAKISRPAEKTKAWYEYREIFLDQRRILGGMMFWNRHQATLDRAEQNYGVPPEAIVAILGVETRYGRITGRDRVLEALATIAFGYPKREKFFRQELEQFLLLTREESIDPLSLLGSYAGAMGLAQFMPSSYRNYAVDFDNDGRRDLWHNPVDAIGSIANYLARFGWQRNAAIVIPARIQGRQYKQFLSEKLTKPSHNIARLRQAGIVPVTSAPVSDQELAFLLRLETEQEARFWLALNNFYTITRYNHSSLYAMAVFELGQEIKRRLDKH